jgi:hypothetical protein
MSWTTLRDGIDTYMASLVATYGSSAYRAIIKGGLFEAVAKGVVDEVTGSIPSNQQTIYTFDESPGPWTLANGTGSATITGGVCRLSSAAGTSPSFTTAPKAYLTHAYNPNHVTLWGRIASTNQTGSAYNMAVALSTAGGYRLHSLATGNGIPYALVNGANVASGSAGQVPMDGTGWLGVRVCGNFCEWYYGAGTTHPTAFTLFHQATITTFKYSIIELVIRYASGALPATFTVTFDDVVLTEDMPLPGM